MPSVMAIVSKAVFEKEARGAVIGDVWATARYASNNPALAALAEGGDLYLVTVRPPEVLCLSAVLRTPVRRAGGYHAKPNTVPIRALDDVRAKLRFASGNGIPMKKGTLGMSLQTPRVLTDADVALLEGVAGTPAKPTKPAKPAKPAARPPGRRVDLAQLERQLAAGKLGDALGGLLALWQTEPSAALAAQIRAVSDAAAIELANVAGKSAEATTTWTRHARRADPTAVPALLATLAHATSENAAQRVKLVARWPADPRVDAAIAGWLEAPPFHALMTKPFWEGVFALGRRIRDPAQVARLAHVDARLAKGVAATMGTWLRAQVAKLRAELEPVVAGVPATTAAATALADELASVEVGRSDLDALLAAVHADPASDAPRLVYADALGERGDPRGELIVIQCQLAATPDNAALRAREAALLGQHGKKWLGPLEHVVLASYRFERGFLAACEIKPGKYDPARQTASEPIWSTVHTLGGGPLELLFSPTMKSLRTVTYDGVLHEQWEDPRNDEYDPAQPPPWRELLAGTVRPFEHLTYRIGADRIGDAIRALARCATLPALKTLHVANGEVELARLAPLFAGPVLARLEAFTLALATRPHAPEAWTPLLRPLFTSARVPRLAIELDFENDLPPMRFVFTRDAGKKPAYASVAIELKQHAVIAELVAVLEAARAVRDVTVAKRGLDADTLAQLEPALNRIAPNRWRYA